MAPTPSGPSTTTAPAVLSSTSALHGWVERASFPGESLGVLVAGGPGLILAGSGPGPAKGSGEAIVRVSSDGSTWRRALVESASNGTIRAIRTVDGTFVALGTRYFGSMDFRGAVWTSCDGERWDLAATFPMVVPQDLVEREGRLLVWGNGGWTEPSGLFVWHLDETGRWGAPRQVDAPDGFVADGMIATSRGFLAYGNRAGFIPNVARGIYVATSPDGVTWRFASPQASFEHAAFDAVVERPDGYLAIGWTFAADGSPRRAVWRSDDGLTWKSTVAPPGSDAGGAGVVTSAGGFLARGSIGEGADWRAASWTSPDGLTWTRLPPGADIPDVTGTVPSAPVEFAGRRISAATLPEGPSDRTVVLLQVGSDP